MSQQRDNNPAMQARGWWVPGATPVVPAEGVWEHALAEVNKPLAWLWTGPDQLAVGIDGISCYGDAPLNHQAYPLQAYLAPYHPTSLGAASFRQKLGLRYAYIAGAMANGIASTHIVEAMAREGMLGIFGAAGLHPDVVTGAIARCRESIAGLPYGFNLIHSPNEPHLENDIVSLYLREGIRLVTASAYLDLTLPLVRYRVAGIHTDPQGRVVCPNQVIAKVSRVEVAKHFWAPPPARMLRPLVEQGHISEQQAQLAAHIPVAEDIIAEADSGGHTDNRAALVLLPVMLGLRDEIQTTHRYTMPLHTGLAGGIATPTSAAAAFAMGADFIVTGSINQACLEAGTSEPVRTLLCQASQSDVMMAPAADMFEMGVQVQVLKRGTMFGPRAKKLYDLYRTYDSLDALPHNDRAQLERDYFRCTLEEAWEQTAGFFTERDPTQITRAEQDPKHLMALVFRSYLGRASKWANAGEPTRKLDYQIWCGPAMGAFNQWVKGSFLEAPEARRVATVGLNLMMGASVCTRWHSLQQQGVVVPPAQRHYTPRPLEQLRATLATPADAQYPHLHTKGMS